ncbi:MAG TPA: nuclear transport factor 2 family protein [Gemmatimonadaceae bacterium]|jgi:ketosteroid isomerase-like protein|nr:nuclear transport factor 2 family protein [Gemmatimonadaceae bacterium]
MNDTAHPDVIDALAAAINARDLAALDAVFTDDIVMDWPQSGERIRGAKNRREIYSRFPSLPTVTPGRITGSGDVCSSPLPFLTPLTRSTISADPSHPEGT